MDGVGPEPDPRVGPRFLLYLFIYSLSNTSLFSAGQGPTSLLRLVSLLHARTPETFRLLSVPNAPQTLLTLDPPAEGRGVASTY